MTDLEKIAYAKSFMDRLANGINPLTGQPAAENDVINNVRMSRCFFFVSDVLRQVIEAGGISKKVRRGNLPFRITPEELAMFNYSESPISISEIVKRINDLVEADNVKKLNYRQVSEWLLSIGALTEQTGPDGKSKKFPTDAGNQIGITLERRRGMYGEYDVILYGKAAQEFIVDNMDSVLSFRGRAEGEE